MVVDRKKASAFSIDLIRAFRSALVGFDCAATGVVAAAFTGVGAVVEVAGVEAADWTATEGTMVVNMSRRASICNC